MSDIESEYIDYETARDNEGGLHPGRSDPSRRRLVMVALMLGLLVLGGIALALIP
ncbi:MAG: hypothetical protein KY475_26605 [Planctomycetes bacterium]|nr:hypothetical protein [Planctomycetota bacterium]